MDELFGVANFSGLEDIGVATIHTKEGFEPHRIEDTDAGKKDGKTV